MIVELARPLCCFDLESTGLDPTNDRIVELGLVKLSPEGTRDTLQRRFDPGIDIPEAATRVHGIRNEDVRGLFGEPPLARLGPELRAFIGDADLCGFNAIDFDLPLWLAECDRHGIAFSMEGRHVVDAKLLFDHQEPSWDRFIQGRRDLNNAVLHYCGREQAHVFAQRDGGEDDAWRSQTLEEQNRHSAVHDAAATLDVLLAQLRRYDDLPRTVPELDALCRQIHEARQAAANRPSTPSPSV